MPLSVYGGAEGDCYCQVCSVSLGVYVGNIYVVLTCGIKETVGKWPCEYKSRGS